jgi:hypothetical protein
MVACLHLALQGVFGAACCLHLACLLKSEGVGSKDASVDSGTPSTGWLQAGFLLGNL